MGRSNNSPGNVFKAPKMNTGRRKGGKYSTVITVIAVIIAAVIYLYQSGYFSSDNRSIDTDADCAFHFIDVGQGDCSMIISKGKVVVIDVGPVSAKDETVSYISRYTDKIDLLIFSHAHEDHMGAAATIMRKFDVGKIVMTDDDSESVFFTKALDEIEKQNIPLHFPEIGETINVGDIEITFFGPLNEYESTNSMSIVCRVSVDGFSVLYEGDAEKDSEKDILAKFRGRLGSDVLKSGHHGSTTSNSKDFVDAVNPSYAVISCGKDNSYGHPHREILAMFREKNISVCRTDEDGSIVINVKDGSAVINKDY